MKATDQSYAETVTLEGERVLVLQGDNTEDIDRSLVREGDVSSRFDENATLQLQDDDAWLCSMIE